jgi:hypothetical protein
MGLSPKTFSQIKIEEIDLYCALTLKLTGMKEAGNT